MTETVYLIESRDSSRKWETKELYEDSTTSAEFVDMRAQKLRLTNPRMEYRVATFTRVPEPKT